MRLSSILKLPKDNNSLSIITKYLTGSLSYKEYQASFSYLCEIGIHLDMFEMVYSQGTKALIAIENHQDTPYRQQILGFVITAALKLGYYGNVEKLIKKRKSLLLVSEQYLGLLDDIALKKELNTDYLADLIKVLNDVIPDDARIYCLNEMFWCYQKDDKHEMALESLYKLYEFDYERLYYAEELELLGALDRGDEVIDKALRFLRGDKKNARVVLALLSVYLKKEDYHKATMLEAEYEALIDSQENDFKIKAYQVIIELYQILGNKPSLSLYQKKLKQVRAKKVVTKETKEKNKLNTIIQKEEQKEKKVHHNLLKHLEISHKLVKLSHEIDSMFSFRDFLRAFFMHVDKHIEIKDYIIYLSDKSPNLYHYKKQRVYDKTIIDQLRQQTVIDNVLSTSNEVFENASNIRWSKDIITQKEFGDNVKFIYSFPLANKGVFTAYLAEELSDPGSYYDLLKLISSIISNWLIDDKKVRTMKRDTRFYTNVLNSPIIAFRQLDEQTSTYSEQAQKLFNIDQHHHLELFLKDIDYTRVNEYKKTIQTLLSKPGERSELFYSFQEKSIVEKLYSLKRGEQIKVISFFFDATNDVKQTKSLIKTATIDTETGVANEYALSKEIGQELSDKASLFLIELNQKLKYLYGRKKTKLFFKEFVQHTKKFFSDGKTYRVGFNQIVVIVSYNDIRRVTKTVKSYLRFITDYKSKVIEYEKFDLKMGILRYPVVTVEKDKDKLFRYLEIALDKAKLNKEHKYDFFVYRDYEDELFEQQVIDQLNIAIENKDLGLVFNQITDVSKNRVWQYESELVLFNLLVESKYLLMIAKKRNRLVDLERYHLVKVCEFLVELEKETQRLIKLTIPLSRETFADPSFNPFILGLFKKYSIPYEFIRLKIDIKVKSSHYLANIQELIDHGLSLDTTSLEMALSYPFNALHLNLGRENIKWNSYLSKTNEVLNGFQMALVVRGVKTKQQKEMLKQLGINYLGGSIYKQLPAPTLIKKIKESL